MTIANCVDFFVSVCVLLSEKPQRARWMGSDHAQKSPEAIPIYPGAKDDTLYLLHDCNLLPPIFFARLKEQRNMLPFFSCYEKGLTYRRAHKFINRLSIHKC